MAEGLGISVDAQTQMLDKLLNAPPSKPYQETSLDNLAKSMRNIGLKVGANGTEDFQTIRAQLKNKAGLGIKGQQSFDKYGNKITNIGASFDTPLGKKGFIHVDGSKNFFNFKQQPGFRANMNLSYKIGRDSVSSREQELRRMAQDKWINEPVMK